MGLEVAMERMSKEKGGSGGRVVVVSSTCGVTCQGDMFATPAYTASKHAVTALTRTMGVSPLATSNLLPAAQVLGGADGGVSGGGGSLLHRFPLPLLLPHSCADTPFLGEWADWTEDTLAAQALQESAQGKKVLE